MSGRRDYLHEVVECIDLRRSEAFGEEGETSPAAERSSETPAASGEEHTTDRLSKAAGQGAEYSGAVLLGYACDAGVVRNSGRAGAVLAPDAIRPYLATRANHMPAGFRLYDGGNIVCYKDELELAQSRMSEAIEQVLARGGRPIVLGGGHDLAFAHGRALYRHQQKAGNGRGLRLLNIDAHLDLRTLNDGKGHSGSPFYQLWQLMGGAAFDYCCFGLQFAGNAPELIERMTEDCRGTIIPMPEAEHDLDLSASRLIEWLNRSTDPVYLTIDLDGLASAYAPGVSAPSPFGLAPGVVTRIIRLLMERELLLSIDLVEYNPKYDVDGMTARLAAGLVAEVLYGWQR